jgi:hypothetical protein
MTLLHYMIPSRQYKKYDRLNILISLTESLVWTWNATFLVGDFLAMLHICM